jgi:hypothetical protein
MDVAGALWDELVSCASSIYDNNDLQTTSRRCGKILLPFLVGGGAGAAIKAARVARAGTVAKTGRPVPRIAGGAPEPDEILRPDGKPIGRSGESPGIREVSTREELKDLFEQLRIHGTPTSSRYPGTGFDLPGGGFIGLRESRQHGPTLDINIPGLRDVRKIHVRP